MWLIWLTDLNNPSILVLYNHIFLFQNDHSKNDIIFTCQSNSEQRVLQSLAHSLDLEYEYSSASRTVRICRSAPSADSMDCGPKNFDFLNCDPLQNIDGLVEPTLDIHVTANVTDTKSMASTSIYEPLTIPNLFYNKPTGNEFELFSELEEVGSEQCRFSNASNQQVPVAYTENSPDIFTPNIQQSKILPPQPITPKSSIDNCSSSPTEGRAHLSKSKPKKSDWPDIPDPEKRRRPESRIGERKIREFPFSSP